MTPISEMTNDQLDRWIAEKREPIPAIIDKISWERFSDIQRESIGEFGTDNWRVKYNPVKFMCDVEREWIPRSFTTDPRYAFELLEEMPMGCVTINSLSGIFGTTNKWEIIMGFDDGEEDHIIHNVSLCRAISLAWAEWRGGE